MKIIGIVVEYNPFHTGHKNHIDKIKKIYPESIIIAAMSGNVVQRGEFSIYDKWSRTKTALENGVDIVVQIPSFDVLNSAETFCRSSIEVLNYFNVDEVIFGSESNDIDNLNKLSNKLLEPSAKSEIESINKRLNSYPKAVQEYLGGELKPNDILGITYISEAKKINDNLLVKSIQRDRDERFKSASEIRKELRSNESSEFDLVKSNPRSVDWIIKIIKAKFINESDEPFVKYIQKVLKNNEVKTWHQYLEVSNNKTFTKARVARETMKYILNLKSEKTAYRVLGTSQMGRDYLKGKEFSYTTKHLKENKNDTKIAKMLDIEFEDNLKDETKKTIINI